MFTFLSRTSGCYLDVGERGAAPQILKWGGCNHYKVESRAWEFPWSRVWFVVGPHQSRCLPIEILQALRQETPRKILVCGLCVPYFLIRAKHPSIFNPRLANSHYDTPNSCLANDHSRCQWKPNRPTQLNEYIEILTWR